MNERGISAVVAMLLIVMLVVAGVVIIWVGVLPMISEDLEFSALDGWVSVVGTGVYTLYDASREVAIVQVEREIDEGTMNRIRISFSVDGNSISSSVVAPGSGQKKVYAFDLSDYGKPDSVAVSPIFVSSSGKERVGLVTSEVKILSGTVSKVRGVVYGMGVDFFSEVPTDGLVSIWTFSGDVDDGWGENDGTRVGDANTDGGVLNLDGTGDYVDCGNVGIPINGPATISGWFKFDAVGGGVNRNLHNLLYVHGGNSNIYMPYNAQLWGGSNPSLGVWYHIVLTYNGIASNSELYMNAVKKDMLQPSSSNIGALTDFRLGGGGQGVLDGMIDDVMVFNRVLTQEEVVVIYEIQKK